MTVQAHSKTLLKKPVSPGVFEDVSLGSLWEQTPVLVVVLRRPGCVLCREESQEIWAHRDEFEKLGVRLVLVVREWIQREIDAFAPAYWGGEYYFDPESVLYATTQGGEIRKASKLSLLNPFSTGFRNGMAAYRRGKVAESNFKGDGTTLGGILAYGKGGKLVYRHAEADFGVLPPLEEVVEAARKAADA